MAKLLASSTAEGDDFIFVSRVETAVERVEHLGVHQSSYATFIDYRLRSSG
jgi:hypothetical protein